MPHTHKMQIKINELSREIGRITAEKNQSYGDSFKNCGQILAILYPNGVKPHQYRDMLGVARVIDKLGRIANRKEAFGENPWKDIAGYGLVMCAVEELEQQGTEEKK